MDESNVVELRHAINLHRSAVFWTSLLSDSVPVGSYEKLFSGFTVDILQLACIILPLTINSLSDRGTVFFLQISDKYAIEP